MGEKVRVEIGSQMGGKGKMPVLRGSNKVVNGGMTIMDYDDLQDIAPPASKPRH